MTIVIVKNETDSRTPFRRGDLAVAKTGRIVLVTKHEQSMFIEGVLLGLIARDEPASFGKVDSWNVEGLTPFKGTITLESE